MAQHESISRKVIAGVITAGVIAVLGLLAKWLLPGLAHLTATFFLTVWHWFVHPVNVPVWLLTALSLYTGITLLRVYLRHRKRTHKTATAQKSQQPHEPHSTDYRCDVFHQITWRWHYGYGGQLGEPAPYCLDCDTEIHPQIGHIDALGQTTM